MYTTHYNQICNHGNPPQDVSHTYHVQYPEYIGYTKCFTVYSVLMDSIIIADLTHDSIARLLWAAGSSL